MNDTTSPAHAAAERLITALNGSEVDAIEQIAAFRASIAAGKLNGDDGLDVLGLLSDVTNWKSTFNVDWKDTESFADSIEVLCEARGMEFEWDFDDGFTDRLDVPALMRYAHAELAEHGLALWNWDTEGDCYSGWIARVQDDKEMRDISRVLGVEFRTGDQPF